MKVKQLRVENLEERTVLSASALIALESVAQAGIQNAQNEAPLNQAVQNSGGTSIARVEVLSGDFNLSGEVDDEDIDMLCRQIHTNIYDEIYDLDNNEAVDSRDMDMLVRDVIGTEYGDANLDGLIDGDDVATLLTSMFANKSGWGNGDFSCDGVIDGEDFITWNSFKFTQTGLNQSRAAAQFDKFAKELRTSDTQSTNLDGSPIADSTAENLNRHDLTPEDSTDGRLVVNPVLRTVDTETNSGNGEVDESVVLVEDPELSLEQDSLLTQSNSVRILSSEKSMETTATTITPTEQLNEAVASPEQELTSLSPAQRASQRLFSRIRFR